MGFWIFMLVNDLLMPVLMIAFGKLFKKNPPKEINSIYGYRTRMSMLNRETWDYAHLYFGRQWLRMGLCVLPFTIIGMLTVYGQDETVVGIVGGAVAAVQIFLMLLPIVWTERELHRRFDE